VQSIAPQAGHIKQTLGFIFGKHIYSLRLFVCDVGVDVEIGEQVNHQRHRRQITHQQDFWVSTILVQQGYQKR
jgi:hypothetical protein